MFVVAVDSAAIADNDLGLSFVCRTAPVAMLLVVTGDVSVSSDRLSVSPRTCFAMPSINIVGFVGTIDNGAELSLACCTVLLGMLLVVTMMTAGIGGDALSYR